MIGQQIKAVFRSLLPAPWVARLRVARIRWAVRCFRRQVVRRDYCGQTLSVLLADPLAAAWYGQGWPPSPEIELLRRHQLRPGARVFDLGAHQGVVAMILARLVGRAGQVVAVEANPHNCRIAAANFAANQLPQVQLVEAAVAERPGRLTFNECLNGEVDNSGAWGRFSVAALTIDELSAGHGFPDLLFLDVEGYEAKVLAGAASTLLRRPDCFVEVHVEKLGQFGDGVQDVLRHFPERDFACWLAPPGRPFTPFAPSSPILRQRFFLIAVGRKGEGTQGKGC